jgi:2-polyprenyl-3-methyl-5-hydroxy-6-metoxy-1,4-benzoquinol methylase
MQKEELEAVYARHHASRGRYGYLFCGGARGSYLQQWIGTGKKVLDLGCRDGMLTRYFAAGNQVVGADIDQEALRRCKEGIPAVETRWLDLNVEWPFGSGEFDVTVACEILEHLFALDPLLAKIGHSLKPGGLFIGSVPNAFRLKNRFKFLFGKPFENDPTHVRSFSVSLLRQALAPHFTDVEIVPIGGKVAPGIPVSARLPTRIGLLCGKDLLFRGRRRV